MHSLNFIGQCADNCCQVAVAFFGFVQYMYVFFSASKHRWSLLESKLKLENLLVVKRLSDTRWSAHSDAVSAIVKGYYTFLALLENISCDKYENVNTRLSAEGLCKEMKKLETGVLATLWYKILTAMNNTKKAPKPTPDINSTVSMLSSLH